MLDSQHAARFGGQNAEGHFQSFDGDFEVGMGVKLLAEQAQPPACLGNVFHSIGSLRLVQIVRFVAHAYILAQRRRPTRHPPQSGEPGPHWFLGALTRFARRVAELFPIVSNG